MQSPATRDRTCELILAGASDSSHPTKSSLEIQQASRLRRLFALPSYTAAAIAELAYVGGRS